MLTWRGDYLSIYECGSCHLSLKSGVGVLGKLRWQENVASPPTNSTIESFQTAFGDSPSTVNPQVSGAKHQLTLQGELCCWKLLLNWSWCWAPLKSPLHPGTWSLPSLGCCCMPPTYAFPRSLWPLIEIRIHR